MSETTFDFHRIRTELELEKLASDLEARMYQGFSRPELVSGEILGTMTNKLAMEQTRINQIQRQIKELDHVRDYELAMYRQQLFKIQHEIEGLRQRQDKAKQAAAHERVKSDLVAQQTIKQLRDRQDSIEKQISRMRDREAAEEKKHEARKQELSNVMEDLAEKIERIEEKDEQSSDVFLAINEQLALLEIKLERERARMAAISGE
jgi:chromosome segregation ATPase